jgi:hypothetical protein
MCLYIKKDQGKNDRDLNQWFGNRKKFAYVYKILIKNKKESFYRSYYYNNFIWDFSKEKVFEVYRDLKPTIFELGNESIDWGLHVYTSLKEAKDICSSLAEAIIKFRVKKEDIIAIENGWYRKEDNFKQAVCTKLTFVKVIED